MRIEATSGGIAAGLRSLFALNDSALQAMGRRGQSLVQAKYSWRNVASEMKQVYEWILGPAPSQHASFHEKPGFRRTSNTGHSR